DFAYFKQPLGDEVLAEMLPRIDSKLLAGYLLKCPSWVRKRVRALLGEEGRLNGNVARALESARKEKSIPHNEAKKRLLLKPANL
ncbi:MAG: hypothetical protein NT157_02135, partial [Candidatus Micrarchaeota archaeon]|nr:hypothetical protein [Candidatus Micrarchaeota archaeon]